MGNVSFNTSNSSISQLSSPCLLKMIPSQQLSRQSAISTPMLRSRAIAKETLQPTPASTTAQPRNSLAPAYVFLPIFQSSNLPIFQSSNLPIFQSSNLPSSLFPPPLLFQYQIRLTKL